MYPQSIYVKLCTDTSKTQEGVTQKIYICSAHNSPIECTLCNQLYQQQRAFRGRNACSWGVGASFTTVLFASTCVKEAMPVNVLAGCSWSYYRNVWSKYTADVIAFIWIVDGVLLDGHNAKLTFDLHLTFWKPFRYSKLWPISHTFWSIACNSFNKLPKPNNFRWSLRPSAPRRLVGALIRSHLAHLTSEHGTLFCHLLHLVVMLLLLLWGLRESGTGTSHSFWGVVWHQLQRHIKAGLVRVMAILPLLMHNYVIITLFSSPKHKLSLVIFTSLCKECNFLSRVMVLSSSKTFE